MHDSQATVAAKPRRRGFRFSLRTVFIVVTLVCVVLGLWVNKAMEQKRTVAAIEATGGVVYYDFERPELVDPSLPSGSIHPAPGPGWLRDWLGIDFFADVVVVNCESCTDEHLRRIGRLPHLVKLDVESGFSPTHVTDAGFATLRRQTRLRELFVAVNGLGDVGLEHLASIESLERLTVVADRATDRGIQSLEKLARLRELRVYGGEFTGTGLEPLGDLPLTLLALHSSALEDDGLRFVARMSKLQTIAITSSQLKGDGLAHLSRLPSLKSVALLNCPALGQLPLHGIPLEGLYVMNAPHLMGQGCEQLAASSDLKSLYFFDCAAIDDSLLASLCDGVSDQPPPGPSGLESLSVIQSPRFSGKTLDALARAPQLVRLSLAGTGVDDAGLARLPSLPQLKSLDLGDTKITDRGLADMNALPQLESLDVMNCAITDASIPVLAKMTSLKTLFATGTQLSDEGIKELQTALPKCHVDGPERELAR